MRLKRGQGCAVDADLRARAGDLDDLADRRQRRCFCDAAARCRGFAVKLLTSLMNSLQVRLLVHGLACSPQNAEHRGKRSG